MPGLFHKPYRVKSHVKLKSTERRQLIDEIRRRYPSFGGDDQAEIRLLGGNRKCDLFKSKIVAHTEQTGFVYFAANQPIMYDFNDGLCPTVYALWRVPQLADGACVEAASGLLPILQNGADLMAPGLVAPLPDLLASGALCCLKLVGGGGFVAVGRLAATASELAISGGRGKAVLVDHVIGDQLWLRGDQTVGPLATDAADEANEAEATTVSEAMAAASVADGAGGDDSVNDKQESEEGDAETTVESADRHLLNCLLHSLLHKIRDKDLPLLCSSLLANYMSRYSTDRPLNLKATSYKKFGAFVQSQRDEGLLELNNDKGVLSVVSINWRHPLLQTDPQPVLTYSEPVGAAASSTSNSDSAEGPLTIEDALFVTATSGELFKRWGRCKGSCLTGKEVRQLITEYVKAEGLQTPGRPGEVTLDALLSRLASQCGRPVLEDSLPWEKLFQVCTASMTPGYRVLDRHGALLLERRGAAPRVSMRVESRASNKSVSLLAGLSDFGVDAAQFAKRVQRALSVSAGVQAAVGGGGGGGGGGEVVSVQGDQLAYLYRLLTEDYQISKKYITGFTPGGKKNKGKSKK